MRQALFNWGPVVFCAGVILVLSLLPSTGSSGLGWDKANHFVAYSGLSFLFTRALSAGSRVTFRSAVSAIIFAFLFGVLVEFLQSLTSSRSPEALDALANGFGATFGAAAMSIMKNRAEVKGCL